MKIQFGFDLTENDIFELRENFEELEGYEELGGDYSDVVVDTEKLELMDFEEFITSWIDAGYKLEKDDETYILTI